jgi:hypothetical protein
VKALLLIGGLLAAARVVAQPWSFGEPVAVTAAVGTGVFHHLESAGRRSIATSGDRVAVIWEDDRSGTPEVYVAMKNAGTAGFGDELRVSSGGEAYEPALAPLGTGRFVAAWEEGGEVFVRVLGKQPGPLLRLGAGGQASLDAADGRVLAVWAEPRGRVSQIRLARLEATAGEALALAATCVVDPQPPEAEQLYPAVVGIANSPLVAWEDRRRGHTVIMWARGDGACGFSMPVLLNEVSPTRDLPYGKGYGVARVALARFGRDAVAAVWEDKRDFRNGYDIFGALSADGRVFGANHRVQDDFGGNSRQWHAAVAGRRDGTLVVAWDDDRDGTSDLWLSWREGEAWSDDLAVPGASGAGEQAHPALALDGEGNLHLAWVARSEPNGPTRLLYLVARPADEA